MDELVHHCLRELSFDGDLGCNVSRLRDFIVGFYSAQDSHSQVVDDALCAFVWSVVVQQPSVRVGTVPPGVTSEVYIAPQMSAKRKAAAKGNAIAEEALPSLLLVENARKMSLEDLMRQYGDDLRIAVDPETSFAAITGSHIRPPKLSPMVYTALQLITRGREEGITTIELGRSTKYDQKTCFYLIKQLIELGFIIKARRGGVGNHTCIHKYFVERSQLWQQIQEEVAQDGEVVITGENIQPRDMRDETVDQGGPSQILFDPIDSRHLSSLPLVKNRIVKLLKASRNYMHASNNLLMTIGFMHPTKTDRRFFQTRLRELIQQGVIERVLVPSNKVRDRTIKCIRLVTPDNQLPEGTVVVALQDVDEDDKDAVHEDAVFASHTEVKAHLSIHKQVSNMLEEAGPSGLTLNEICTSLGHFDKRTIELLLTRASKTRPPAHLSDLGTVDMMETYGRERRHRYFTVSAYKTVVASEQLQETTTSLADVDLSRVGEFAELDSRLFYNTTEELHAHQDSFKEKAAAKSKKRKRGGDDEESSGEESEPPPKPKRGRPRKTPAATVGSPAPPKERDRPRKQLPPDGGNEPKKRGRPPKKRRTRTKPAEEVPTEADGEAESTPLIPVSVHPPSPSQTHDREIVLTGNAAGEPPLHAEVQGTQTELTVATPTAGSSTVAGVAQQLASPSGGLPAKKCQKSRDVSATKHPLEMSAFSDRDVSGTPAEPIPRRSTRKSKQLVRGAESLPTHEKAPVSSRAVPGPSVVDLFLVGETPVVQSEDGNTMVTDDSQPLTKPDESSSQANTLVPEAQGEHEPSNSTLATFAEREPSPASVEGAGAGEKRKETSRLSSSRPAKRGRTKDSEKSRSNINISSLRRENELHKVIDSLGGIANMHSKDILEAHAALLDTMTQAKEPTSAPVGTRIDKRTVEATFKGMENRGRIKMLKTSLISSSGVNKPACLVYLPETPQEKVNAFLRQLSQNIPSATVASVKTLEEPVDYGTSVRSVQRASLPLQLLQMEEQGEKQDERLKQLFSYDNNTLRDLLLTERTTVAQLYGFIVSKALRLRQLHLHTLELFQQPSPSPLVISSQHGIIDISYYHQDVSLVLYCSLVAVVVHDEDLLKLLGSDEGKQTLIKQLPVNISASLQIGKSRSRSRILDLLEMLRSLGLVTPLERTDAVDAPYQCVNSDGDTVAFREATLEGWSAGTPVIAPRFWRFHTSGSIYLWALSESCPSYWKDLPINTPTEGAAYWDELHNASRDQAYAQSAVCPPTSPPSPLKASASFGKCLRRRSSWDPEYVLTWHQKQYLARHMVMSTGETPLNAEDADAQLDQICYVTSAPRRAVVNHFATSADKITQDLEKARQRLKRTRAEKDAQQDIDAKAALLRKAEEAKAQRERDWEELLHRIHPEPVKGTLAVRIRAVRSRFVQSTITKDQSYWENQIQETIKDAGLAAREIISQPKAMLVPRVHKSAAGPPRLVANPPEKSIEILIAQQGPPITQPVRARRKGKTKEEIAEAEAEVKSTPRRARFHWTREYDELARDASVIIRARCRDGVRLDLSAFDQVFPAVPKNSVRQRATHLRESAADDLYMTRLEDQWYAIWLQHRGTPYLPDEDPSSPSNFDLIKHIEFLRRHVDKNALRVGFVERQAAGKLTASVEELYERYEVREDIVIAPTWDFMWNTMVEEGREKQFLRQAFTKEPDIPLEGTKKENVQLAEAALKMVFGTPSELYNAANAAKLLHSAGEQSVSLARTNLLQQGVLSKLVRDPKKPKPGRTLKISDTNLNAIGGPFPRDFFQDAISLDDIAVEKVVDEMEWPLVASEGDIATLLQLVSEDQVDFTVDLTQSRYARPKIDWNSKRADDDDIETDIRLKFARTSTAEPDGPENGSSETPFVETDSDPLGREEHGKTLDGKEAACTLKTSSGLVNCSGCINAAFTRFASGLSQSDGKLARRIFDGVRTFKDIGANKTTCLGMVTGSQQHLLELVHKMTLTSPPILFWTCYNVPTLVAGDYYGPWSVIVSDDPLTLVSPRRWLDPRGYRLDSAWSAALRAVVGVIFLHPGIGQAELRWRLRAVYDRPEVLDLLSSLQQEGVLECRAEACVETIEMLPGWLLTLGEKEERMVFWFIAKKRRWYQV
ncbi:hypothetical protein BDN67DRAFT_941224 [Paxillus ammoniavirescens]|nr:hypothetical protein BDN67DRAFT_941224 [Paxillus ammoniavirescens]